MMYTIFNNKVESCDRCQRGNNKLKKAVGGLHPIPVKPRIFHQLGMDLIGPLPEAAQGKPASHSPTLIRQVAAMMKCSESSFRMRYINVQMQAGSSDCGLFAIAFAVALCAGKDPHKCSFDQGQMRRHLYQCLEKGELSEFPASKKPRRCTSSIKSIKTIQVYCMCRLPWDKDINLYGSLAQCDGCRNWFHQKCMNIPDAAFVEQSFSWLCTSYSLL